jgi:transposase
METPKKRGRPSKVEGDKLERVTMFLPREVRLKVEQYGQEWARGVLRRARPPDG